ncbi:MAG TPA: hypothetical protein VN436_14555, partial [Holophaga sp.]|nr:hypothetical protein [Holophaga sp.]
MSQGLHLGGRWYAPVLDLGIARDGCAWRILGDEEDGSRWVLQMWSPRPSDREFDVIRETYLQRFTGAEAMDPPACRFGLDKERAWFLQGLSGSPLAEGWSQWGAASQEAFLTWLRQLLGRDLHPRLLHPAVISVREGRVLVPRVIGEAPVDWEAFRTSLAPGSGGSGGPQVWERMPDLSDKPSAPIRGRGQELTYLKSLVLGLSSPAAMERIIVLQGEEGMGLHLLAGWAGAVAETESIWVRQFDVQHGEKAGPFLGRMLQSLLAGFEADLYANSPGTARTLSRRLPTFAFLHGGRRLAEEAPVEPKELLAALQILAFLASIQPRMIQVRCLERADAQLQAVLRELVTNSRVAWCLSATISGPGNQAKGLFTPLRSHASAAFLNLNRLEDHDLLDLMDDLLQPNSLDSSFRAEVCQASLGNPGMLHRILENAQMEGALAWTMERGWYLPPDRTFRVRVQEDLEGKVLAGRLHRLEPAPTAVLRFLALADQVLPTSVLGRALGLAGDPLEEVLRAAFSSKLAVAQDGTVRLAGPRVKEIVLDTIPEPEAQEAATALLKALGEEASPVLSLHLESLASDEQAVLAGVMQRIELEAVPRPADAAEIVRQALRMHPSPAQAARLWEFLADAWSQATIRGRMLPDSSGDHTPFEWALEALGNAQAALRADAEAAPTAHRDHLARLFRKEAFLGIRARDLDRAMRALQSAAECLADQPGHPEHPRLRLGLGRVYLL